MAAAKVLHEAARQVVILTLAQAVVLLLMGGGCVAPPAQTSAGPPSTCSAQFSDYINTGLLLFFFGQAAVGAVSLAGAVAWGGLDDAAGGATTRARALVMAAGALSAASSALALAAAYYILQARVGVISCLPSAARAAVPVGYIIVGMVLAFFYAQLARVLVSAAE